MYADKLRGEHIINLHPRDEDIRRNRHNLELDDIKLWIVLDTDLDNICITHNNNIATEDWCRKNHGIALVGTEKWIRSGVKYYVHPRIIDKPEYEEDTDPGTVPVD